MKEENNGLDIFEKGFVKPEEKEIEIIEIEEEKNEYDFQDKDLEPEIKESQLEPNEVIVNKSKKTKNKKLWLIGIIIEILIICFLIWFTFFRKNYKTVVECTDTVKNNDYYITTNNLYYFDSDSNVVRTDNEISYSFSDEKSYKEFKKNFVESNINDIKGIKQENSFDDNELKYITKTIYDYDKIKKNKSGVKIEDKLITVKIKDRENPITIYIQNVEEVAAENNQKGFICKEKE